MEKGEIRFHGPTAELLERPDVLRSVFLEGASRPASAPAAGRRRRRRAGADDRPAGTGAGGRRARRSTATRAASTRRRPTPAAARRPARCEQAVGALRRHPGRRRRVVRASAPGEVVGIIGPNGAGKTTLFDLISASPAPTPAGSCLGGATSPALGADRRARRGLGRIVPGRPPVPVAHRRGDARGRPRAVGRRARPAQRRASACPPFVDTEAAAAPPGRRADRAAGLEAFRSKFVGELSTGSRRVVDLACVLAHRARRWSCSTSRRAASPSARPRRSARCCCASATRSAPASSSSSTTCRSSPSVSDRLVALDQGQVVTSGAPDEVLAHPDGRRVLPRRRRAPSSAAPARHGRRLAPTEVPMTPTHRHAPAPRLGRSPASVRSPSCSSPSALVAVLASTGRAATRRSAPTGGRASSAAPAPANDPDLPITYARGQKAGEADRVRLGRQVRPRDRADQGARRLRPAVRRRPSRRQRRRHQPGRHRRHDQGRGLRRRPTTTSPPALQAPARPARGHAPTPATSSSRCSADLRDLGPQGRDRAPRRAPGSDETAARADAVKVADGDQGRSPSHRRPGQQPAYADELASRGVALHRLRPVGARLGVPGERPVHVGQPPDARAVPAQLRRLHHRAPRSAARPSSPATRAARAGSGSSASSTSSRTRRCSTASSERPPSEGERAGYEPTVDLTYQLDIAKLPETARDHHRQAQGGQGHHRDLPRRPDHARSTSPRRPPTQDYFPEWIITGTVLTDTTAFGRLYDQEQWAHAFGLSNLPARVPRGPERGLAPVPSGTTASRRRPRRPRASSTRRIRILMLGHPHGRAEPHPRDLPRRHVRLPAERRRPHHPADLLRRPRPVPRRPTSTAVDDMHEIWWDAEATGPDEQGKPRARG